MHDWLIPNIIEGLVDNAVLSNPEILFLTDACKKEVNETPAFSYPLRNSVRRLRSCEANSHSDGCFHTCYNTSPFRTETPTVQVLPSPVPGELYVDPGRTSDRSAHIFLAPTFSMYGAVPAESVQTALNSHVTALRFPGGQWGNANDILPLTWKFSIAFCAKMGAIPTISVRYQGGTPEKAAELVRYANIEKKYGVAYWSIGNEPDYELEDGKKIDPRISILAGAPCRGYESS